MNNRERKYYADLAKEIEEKYERGEILVNAFPPKDASVADKAKFQICQKICEIYNNSGKSYGQKWQKSLVAN